MEIRPTAFSQNIQDKAAASGVFTNNTAVSSPNFPVFGLLKAHGFAVRVMILRVISQSHGEAQESHGKQTDSQADEIQLPYIFSFVPDWLRKSVVFQATAQHGNEVQHSCDQRLFFSSRCFAPRGCGFAA